MTLTKDQLLTMVDKVPAFPQSVAKILTLTADADCSPKQLISVIEHDPILTLKVLKLVNSSYFGLSREVVSVNHAAVYVGINTIKNLAISVAASGTLPKLNQAGLDMNDFWLHSLTVGVIARSLAQQKSVPQTDLANYFVAGLLHDIGRVLFAHFHPQQYAPVIQAFDNELSGSTPLHEIELQQLGIEHSQLGGLLAQKWELPQALVDCISYHHKLEQCQQASDLVIAIACANRLCEYYQRSKKVSVSNRGDIELPNFSQIELSWMQLRPEQAIETLATLGEELSKAKAFIN